MALTFAVKDVALMYKINYSIRVLTKTEKEEWFDFQGQKVLLLISKIDLGSTDYWTKLFLECQDYNLYVIGTILFISYKRFISFML